MKNFFKAMSYGFMTFCAACGSIIKLLVVLGIPPLIVVGIVKKFDFDNYTFFLLSILAELLNFYMISIYCNYRNALEYSKHYNVTFEEAWLQVTHTYDDI